MKDGGNAKYSGDREIRVTGRFKKNWEILEIQKIGRFGRMGEIVIWRKKIKPTGNSDPLKDSVDSEDSGDSGDSRDSGDSGDSEDSGDS